MDRVRLNDLTAHRAPWQHRRRVVVELVLLVVVFLIFSRVHSLLGRDHAAATANAISLQGLERSLDIDIELGANQWLATEPSLIRAAVLTYRLYYLLLVGVLLWVLLRHKDIYQRVRNSMIAMAALALLVYWLVPMSPPRFAQAGIVDIVAQHDLFAGDASHDLSSGQNNLSAMPSMHVGWSALCAYAAWLVLRERSPRLALLPWLFPLLMVGVVITTGNHFLLDVVGSALVLLTSIAAAGAMERLSKGPRAGRRPPLRHAPPMSGTS